MKLKQSDDREKEGEEGDGPEQGLVVSGNDVSFTLARPEPQKGGAVSRARAACDSDYGRPLSTWGWELETGEVR